MLIIVGMAFARVIFGRLKKLAERLYPKSHGFKSESSMIDMIFSLGQIQGKYREPLYIVFIELTKEFE